MRRLTCVAIACALSAAACQEQDGPCPSIDEVSPSTANRGDVVEVHGDGFALGHQDLFDDGSAVAPTARLVVDSEAIAAYMPDMAGQEMELSGATVTYVSSTQLAVAMPDVDWNDLTSSMSMLGIDVPELPAGLAVLPIPVVLSVENPTGCDGTYDGDLTFNLEVPQEGGAK